MLNIMGDLERPKTTARKQQKPPGASFQTVPQLPVPLAKFLQLSHVWRSDQRKMFCFGAADCDKQQ